MKRIILALLLCIVTPCLAENPVLKPGDSLAVCGDSITEQKLYSVFIEDYLLMCKPVSNIETMQFGWSGEKADGFAGRMMNDVIRFKPRVATTCYGMNDGLYQQINDAIANKYRDNMNKVVESFTMNGVNCVVGAPGCVDSVTFKRPNVSPAEYNKTLAAERDIAKDIAEKRALPFADVYQTMYDAMIKAKQKYGQDYPVAGPDGIHPNANGHVLMAYAFLKALGVNGDIGTITVDLATKKATGSDGHTIKSFDNDTVTIESTKYPFCFLPDAKDPTDDSLPNSMRGILQFVPFNEDLNRFKLVVTGAGGNVKITWGEKSKQYTAEQLVQGINLAADFLDNPFMESFTRVHEAVQAQQGFETPFIKNVVNSRLRYHDLPGSGEVAMNHLIDVGTQDDANMRSAAAKAVMPVTHMIKIEIVK